MKYPYNDEEMIYDYKAHRYVLTHKAIQNIGIDLNGRIKNNSTSSNTIINQILSRVSLMTYNFIHKYNNSQQQDYILAKYPTAREILKEAMKMQATYFLTVGDLSMSLNKDEREMWFSDLAKEILYQNIEELGQCILYTGVYPIPYNVNISYKGGEY